MFLDFLFRKSHLQQLCRHAADDTVRWERLRHHCPCSHHRSASYRHTLQYRHVGAAPHIILYRHGQVVLVLTVHELLFYRDISNVLSKHVYAVVARDNRRVRTEEHLLAYGAWCVGAVDRTALRYLRTVAYREVPQSLYVRRHRTQIHVLPAMLHAVLPHRRPHRIP